MTGPGQTRPRQGTTGKPAKPKQDFGAIFWDNMLFVVRPGVLGWTEGEKVRKPNLRTCKRFEATGPLCTWAPSAPFVRIHLETASTWAPCAPSTPFGTVCGGLRRFPAQNFGFGLQNWIWGSKDVKQKLRLRGPPLERSTAKLCAYAQNPCPDVKKLSK